MSERIHLKKSGGIPTILVRKVSDIVLHLCVSHDSRKKNCFAVLGDHYINKDDVSK